ncbi:MAG: DMT family transporter [Pseudomonadota bacterium]|nr:DMT family transporter [Pseudomonadota bacterium]
MTGFTPVHDVSRGILLRVASAGCFSLMAAMMKYATTFDPVSAAEMVFYRALFGLPVVLVWVMAGPGLSAIRTRRPHVHLWRCSLGVSGILLIFEALRMLPLADATTIGFTAPIFATLLSILVLKEAVGPRRWAAVILGFVGVAVVVQPGASGGPPLAGLLIGLAGAFMSAAVTVTLRQLGKTETTASIVFWFFVACAAAGGLLMAFSAEWRSWPAYAALAAGGLAGGAAQLFMTNSLRHAPVGVVAPFDYLQIVGAVAFGWWLMQAPPTVSTLTGAALIASAGVYTAWREQVRRREATPSTPPPI